MFVHRITLDLDDAEYGAIVTSLREHESVLRDAQYNDVVNGIDHNARQQGIDRVTDLIAKIDEAMDDGEML